MINNDFYRELGERWHTSEGDAVALLRAENAAKTPWVLEQIRRFHSQRSRVLDIGCGGGFLTLALAAKGYECTGLDVADEILSSGRARDVDHKINWVVGSAEQMPFAAQSFDVVCMMDVLEHLRDPQRAVQEAVRVLEPNGTYLFHTFNRTWLAWLFAAKGLDWFIPESPENIHDWRMFIQPSEIAQWLEKLGWRVVEFRGLHPAPASVMKLLVTRRVPPDFRFKIGKGLGVGYLGCARKRPLINKPNGRGPSPKGRNPR